MSTFKSRVGRAFADRSDGDFEHLLDVLQVRVR